MGERIDREELRLLIREALKEALGARDPSPPRGERVAGPKDRLGEGSSSQHRPSPSPTPSPQVGGERRGDFQFGAGVLNETKVADIGRAHAKIIIGTEVAVTPLARDRAREIKVEIVRQKP